MKNEGWQRFNDDDGGDLWEGEVTVVRHSEKAVLCDHEGEEAWVPYSQIHDDSEVYHVSKHGETGNLVIPEWLAEKKGWL